MTDSPTLSTTETSPALSVTGLRKSYELGKDSIPVLQGLSLDVQAGELVAIMGPSGSGKTTLLNCIAAIDRPDDGGVELAGTAIDYGSERARTLLRRRDIGIVFQFFNLIPTLSVRENIALPQQIAGGARDEREARVTDLLERVGLNARSAHLPHQLSGGEMQLVSIARALVHRPALLLADEPTGNVDDAIAVRLLYLFEELNRMGTTVVIATHNQALIDRFKHDEIHLNHGGVEIRKAAA